MYAGMHSHKLEAPEQQRHQRSVEEGSGRWLEPGGPGGRTAGMHPGYVPTTISHCTAVTDRTCRLICWSTWRAHPPSLHRRLCMSVLDYGDARPFVDGGNKQCSACTPTPQRHSMPHQTSCVMCQQFTQQLSCHHHHVCSHIACHPLLRLPPVDPDEHGVRGDQLQGMAEDELRAQAGRQAGRR